MPFDRRVSALVLLMGLAACGASPPPGAGWTVRFGPVIGDEAIVGRVAFGRTVWLTTSDGELVRIDVDSHQHRRDRIGPLSHSEELWGLAAAEPPGLWTLVGRRTLAQIGSDGRVLRRVALAEPHVNVFTGHGELVFQTLDLAPNVPVLQAGPPGDAGRRPWSAMRSRELPLPRAEAVLMNMVTCGATASGVIPCWFPESPVVTLTSSLGASHEVALEGLEPAPFQAILAAERPVRPLLDVFVSREAELWVLGAGEPAPGAETGSRGGWLLTRHSAEGRLLERLPLQEPARLVLGVTSASCLLLAGTGHVVELWR